MIKVLTFSLIILFLSGCVSYNYTPGSPGYLAYDAQTEQYSSSGSSSHSYAAAQFYPWWSIDYFYLGSHYYRPWLYPSYRDFYGQPYWYYSWYDPWYRPFYNRPLYGWHYGWPDPYWHHRYRKHSDRWAGGGRSSDHPATGYQQRPAPGRTPSSGDYRGNIDKATRFRESMYRQGSGYSQERTQQTSRYVSTGSSKNNSNKGMVIISPANKKVGQSQTGPVSKQRIGATVRPGQTISPPRQAATSVSTPVKPVSPSPGRVTSVNKSRSGTNNRRYNRDISNRDQHTSDRGVSRRHSESDK